MSAEKLSDERTLAPFTPGAKLKEARETRGLAAEDVAKELRFTLIKLRALEADHYEKLQADTFVRGYIRSYAKFLEMDSDALIEEYEGYLQQLKETTEAVTRLEEDQRPQMPWSHWPSWWPFALAGFFILVTTLALMGGEENPATSEVADDSTSVEKVIEQPAVESSTEDSTSDNQGLTWVDKDKPVESLQADTEQQPYSSEAVVPEILLAESSAEIPVEAASTSLDGSGLIRKLAISFSDECWVEVTDAGGEVLLTELFQADDATEVIGQAPFTLMLGNAMAVTVTLDGDLVNVNPGSGRKTLRLTVGEQRDI